MTASRSESDFSPAMSRRTFNKVVLGTGAALAAGNALSGCGTTASSSPQQTETKTLHFNLAGYPTDSTHELRVMGRRYNVVPHTPATLQQAITQNPGLAVNSAEMTHHVPDVVLSAEKPHLFSVTTHNQQRGDGLALVGMHIPSSARAAVRSGIRRPSSKLVCGPEITPVCCNLDQVPDEFITGFDTAKAIVMHHPEIVNLNSDIAAQVEVHICASAEVANLAVSVCIQGPAYEHDPMFLDGWSVLVPRTNADGTPMKDRFGRQIYDYKFSDKTGNDLKAAVNDVLSRVKNDTALKDKMYAVRQHDVTDDGSIIAKISERYRLWKSGGVDVAATSTGYNHNVWFKKPVYTGSGSTRSFSLDIVNMNFIWYGVYFQYLDAAGRTVGVTPAGPMLAGLESADLALLSWLESDTVKWQSIISSPPTVFGVPLVPYPSEFSVTMPEGASSVRVMLCGPGAFGRVDFSPSLAVGIILTSVLQYALPTYFITSGKGLDEDSTLWDVLKQKGMILKLVMTASNLVKGALSPSSVQQAAMIGSIQGLLASLLEDMIVLVTNGSMPKLTEWVVEKTSEEEAEDAVPFVGWVIRIVTLLGTVADLVTATTEVATNPLVIDNVISFTASVDVTVNCDPLNYQFPEEATYYEVLFTVTGASFPSAPVGFTLSQSVRGQRSFRVTIDAVPTTGRTDDAVDIWFYSGPEKKWLAGHGRATFANRPAADGSITATVTITENPIPLTATTVYSQHRKLEYLAGRYVWNEDPATLRVPAIEATDCGSGLCELTNITVWVPGGMLGYSWESANQHVVKNVNAQEADPNPGMKLLHSAIGAPTPVAYDTGAPYTPANMNGSHFYLDPVDISIATPAYYLRKLSLDPASGQFKATGSWGRFAIQLDRLAVHPLGYVVGISANNHKMAVLKLPDQPYANDTHTNNAVIKLGYGDTEKFVKKPLSLAISRTNAILVLEGESSISIKAFDLSGNPWPFFKNGTTSSFPLDEPDAKWLDIAIDDTDMLYILSYTGDGTQTNDYRLDVYDKSGSRVLRNTGIPVARMTVDRWRRVYTLNQEVMRNSPMVEPTVSVWMPSVPA